MAHRISKILLVFLLTLSLEPWALSASAAGSTHAEDITDTSSLSSSYSGSLSALRDGVAFRGVSLPKDSSFTIKNYEPIGSLYLQFVHACKGKWSIEADNKTVEFGNGYLHEFVDITKLFGSPQATVTLRFPGGASLGEINAFTEGETPGWVQKWQPPCEKADLLVCPAHSDDEQLYFAGVIPDAVARGLNVEVVYFTDEYTNDIARPQEELDSLWTVGVHNYPVTGPFPDCYSESAEKALSLIKEKAGRTETDVEAFQTEMLRRFKPLVVVGHDFNGEYGHGEHKLDANSLAKALDSAADAQKFPESVKTYGTWNTLKAYFHLYSEKNSGIVCDFDKPLNYFSGKTAFQMSQIGFEKDKSQHKFHTFVDWLYGNPKYLITKASSIEKYNPEKFGLYRSTVGPDVLKNDMFENITLSAAAQATASSAVSSGNGSSQTVASSAVAAGGAVSRAAAVHPADAAKPDENWLLLMIPGAVIFVFLVGLTAARLKVDHRRENSEEDSKQTEEPSQHDDDKLGMR